MMKMLRCFQIIIVFIFCLLVVSCAHAFEDKLTDADRESDRILFDLIEKRYPKSELTVHYKYKDGHLGHTHCNVSAITVLLNRKMAADNRSDRFTIEEVLHSFGCRDISYYEGQDSQTHQYWYWNDNIKHDTGVWGNANRPYTKGGVKYTVKQIDGGTARSKAGSSDNITAYFANLLHEHPYGVAVHFVYKRDKNGNPLKMHAVVIYKYEYVNGEYILYVKENVGGESKKSFFDSNIGQNKVKSKQQMFSMINFIVCFNEPTALKAWTTLETVDDYYTVKGISPDPSDKGTGFIYEGNYNGPTLLQTYSVPEANAEYEKPKVAVLRYFHVKEIVKNHTGDEWFKLDDDSFVQPEKLSEKAEFSIAKNVQPGIYKANIRTQWGKAPFDAHDENTDCWIDQNETVEVARGIINKYNKTWYEIAPEGSGKWIYSGHFDYIRAVPTLTISGQNAPPKQMKKGKGLELYGTITSSENIVSVVGSIINQKTLLFPKFSVGSNPAEINPNAKSVNINTYKINNSNLTINTSLKFGELPVGDYVYTLVATTSSGYSKAVIFEYFSVCDDEPATGDVATVLATSLEVNKSSLELYPGTSYRLLASVKPEGVTNPSVSWVSSDPSVAIVDPSTGTVTAVDIGTTVITVSTTDGTNLSKQIRVTCVSDTSTVSQGSCGEGLTWTLNNQGVLVIRGVGAMESFGASFDFDAWELTTEAPWRDKSVKSVIIQSGVTGIGYNAFCGCNELRSVSIPGSVSSIGSHAFSYCDNLESITIPYGVTSIGSEAFRDCHSLKSAFIADSVTSMGDWVFYWCTGLETVKLSSNCTSIGGDHAFYCCDSLKSIVIPEGITRIDEAAFRHCISMTDIVIPSTVTSIGAEAFKDCESLLDLVIPTGVTSIEDETIYNCQELRSITIPDTVTSIGKWNFNFCYELESIRLPDNLTELGERPFFGCWAKKYASMDSSTAHLLSKAGEFFHVSGLNYGMKYLYDGETVSGIEIGEVDEDVTYFLVSDEIDSINSYAFNDCNQLKSIVVSDINQNYSSFDGALYNKDGTELVLCPKGKGSVIIREGTRIIGDSAFNIDTKLSVVSIPDGVTTIGSYAFNYCEGLTSISIPESVKVIDEYAFRYCYYLKDVYYSGSEAKWNEISIGEGNSIFDDEDVHIHFADELLQAPVLTLSPDNPTTDDRVSIMLDQAYDNIRISVNRTDSDDDPDIMTFENTASFDFQSLDAGEYLLLVEGQVNGKWTQPAVIGFTVLPKLHLNDYGGEMIYLLGSGLGEMETDNAYSTVLFVAVDNSEPMIELFGDNPEWYCEQISGETIDYSCEELYAGSDTRGLFVWINSLPENEINAVLRITCRWGGMEDSKDCTIHFLDVNPPTGLSNVPESVTAFVGDTVTVHAGIEPLDWQVDGIEPYFYWAETESFAEGNDTLVLTRAGDYSATYMAAVGNVILYQDVFFHIIDIPENPEWSVVLPTSLNIVEEESFMGSGMKTVYISNGCLKIEKNAFTNSALEYIYIPASVGTIGESAFPENTVIFTCEGSYVTNWAKGKYKVVILREDE